VPRGIAALGYTVQLPTEDRYLMTRSELDDRLAVLLAGRVTEEIVFGDVSTGAQNDLTRATDIARAMVKEYGMSDKMGLMTYERPHNPFLKGESWLPSDREYSDRTAAEIDDEVRRILDDTHDKTRKIVEDKRDLIDALARLLLDKEVVDREEFKKLIASKV
jgi:cell division protease FtsH